MKGHILVKRKEYPKLSYILQDMAICNGCCDTKYQDTIDISDNSSFYVDRKWSNSLAEFEYKLRLLDKEQLETLSDGEEEEVNALVKYYELEDVNKLLEDFFNKL